MFLISSGTGQSRYKGINAIALYLQDMPQYKDIGSGIQHLHVVLANSWAVSEPLKHSALHGIVDPYNDNLEYELWLQGTELFRS